MRPYEVMVIYGTDVEEQSVHDDVEAHRKNLETAGAELGYVDYWGKRRFAYEIDHRSDGWYVVMQARAEPAAMDQLHRSLSLADEVVRHKVLRIPEEAYGPPAALRDTTES